MNLDNLKKQDIEIYEYIKEEEKRQSHNIELIASENFVSDAVREAVGSVLTNKYAEGYSGNRYYGGCENIDKIETLANFETLRRYHLASLENIIFNYHSMRYS